MPKLFAKVDLLVLSPALLLSGFGLLMIYSISFSSEPSFFYRQAIYLLVGIALFFVLSRIDFKILSTFSPVFYFLVILLLVFTALVGSRVQGSVRWIDFGFVTIQASEIAKPVLLLFFATFFAKYPPKNIRNIIFSAILALIPVYIVFHQPDFGNAFMLFGIWGFMLFVAGLNMVFLAGAVISAVILSPILWNSLKDYQRTRVLSFLNLSADPQGASYNVVQALIAFGSGQVFGKGLGKGTQSHLDFLPAEKTDFIFASSGEELGFAGIALLIAIFGFLFYRLLKAASEITDKQGKILIFGVGFSLFLQFFVNTGVNIGLIPVTGITLPFVSFGGSSLVAVFASLGLVQSARNTFKKYDRDLTS